MIKIFISLFFIFIFSSATAQEIKETPQVGDYEISLTTLDLLGQEMATSLESTLKSDQEVTWEIQVPKNYDPQNPPGILVYVSPGNQIKIPSGWMKVVEENNLIWVAATMSGNKIPPPIRILKSVLALPLVQKDYKINNERVYISGLSGGGRIASIVAMEYPHLFKGAIYNSGVNFWDNHTPPRLDLIKQNRYVFITGTEDFNLQDTKSVRSKYRKAGVKNTKLMIIQRMGHQNPKSRKLAQAIKYLDNDGS